jgi:LacI family transcriptional regulator
MTAANHRSPRRRPAGRKRDRSPSAAPSAASPQLHGGASIYDVAARAGVSVVTVSRVFNDYPHVSDTMRARVLTAAREVGYTPRLVSKRNLIGVIVGHLDHLSAGDYKTRLLLHLVRAAADHGYLVEFIPHQSAHLATKHLADGLLEVGLTSEEVEALADLPPVPKVAINKEGVDGGWNAVCSDHAEETRLAMRHLQEHGHRRIALVLDEDRGWGVEGRRRGYEESLRQCPAPDFRPLVLFASQMAPPDIARQVHAARCTACINLTDNHGFAVVDGLTHGMGLRVPDDLSLICLENTAVSGFLSPRLTTVAQPLADIAAQAIRGLVELIEGRGQPFSVQVQSRLIPRESVRGLN